MAKLRAAKAYRKSKRPYTRTSKRKKKGFIKGAPNVRVVMFDSGDKQRTFPYEVQLISSRELQVRDNALESARQTAVRYLSGVIGKLSFLLKIKAVPHQIIREHPLATGAGADRFSQGMSHPYGKSIGHAAPVKYGKIIIGIYLEKKNVAFGKIAAKKASSKLPMKCHIKIKENK
jgi:large subunit ribosomal protein L10e